MHQSVWGGGECWLLRVLNWEFFMMWNDLCYHHLTLDDLASFNISSSNFYGNKKVWKNFVFCFSPNFRSALIQNVKFFKTETWKFPENHLEFFPYPANEDDVVMIEEHLSVFNRHLQTVTSITYKTESQPVEHELKKTRDSHIVVINISHIKNNNKTMKNLSGFFYFHFTSLSSWKFRYLGKMGGKFLCQWDFSSLNNNT